MNKSCLTVAALVAVLTTVLGGCAPPPVVLTPEQLEQARTATLNIYDDNTVAVRVVRPSKKSQYWDFEENANVFETKKPILKTKSEDYIAWQDNKDEALVYSTGAHYYNARDLTRIVKDNLGLVAVLYFKDGKVDRGPLASLTVLWCTRDKVCHPTNSGGMHAFYENQLDIAEKYHSAFKTANGIDVRPVLMETEIDVFSDAEYAQLMSRTRRLAGAGGANLAKVASTEQRDAFHESILAAVRTKKELDAQERAKGRKVTAKACPAARDWSKTSPTVLVLNGCDPATVERYFTQPNSAR